MTTAKTGTAKKGTVKKSAVTASEVQSAKGAKDKTEFPIIAFRTLVEWEAWLAENHASARGVWVKLAKKDSGIQSIDYPQALDGALAWGWIDGLKKGFDAKSWIQKFTPRGPKSLWSKINREKIEALTRAGKMQPAGLAHVERAKQDGRWDAAYDSQKTASVPEDLQRALDASPKAKAFFAKLNSANRYAMVFRVHNAKKAETRAKHVARFIEMLENGETLHPQKGL